MSEITIRRDGNAGHITLTRPQALNALTHDMVLKISAALAEWKTDPNVALVLIDAEGERAFCAGGDIAMLYTQIMARDYEPGRNFWRDEYRMNAMIARYPKPIVTFLQGFTMGGGVGLGCHASERIVGESSRVAMPECSIGFLPDVGGSLLLARTPGRAGEFLALTSARMTGPDAIYAGFANRFIPETDWPGLKSSLVRAGDVSVLKEAAAPVPEGRLAADAAVIDRLFAPQSLQDILAALKADAGPFASAALEKIGQNAPLAMAACLRSIAEARRSGIIEAALACEYRYVYRSLEQGDFAEGIRARIIDKDNAPRWRHSLDRLPSEEEVAAMLAPLGPQELRLEGNT